MDADAEADRLAQIMFEELVQLGNVGADHGGCPQRLPAGLLPGGVKAEQRQLPIAEKLVGLTAAFDHRLRHRAEETVDDEYRIERQPVLREPGRAAHIDEHADEIALLS